MIHTLMYGFDKIPPTDIELLENHHHFIELQKIVSVHGLPYGCGSYLMDGKSLDYTPIMYPKQVALRSAAKGKKRGIEIGVNAGHSLLLILIANQDIVLDAIDICELTYTEPCVKYLQDQFPNRINFYKGDSHKVLESMDLKDKYDFIHIDGYHEVNHVKKEIDYLEQNDATCVIDDIEGLHGVSEHLQSKWPNLSKYVPNCIWTNAVFSKKEMSKITHIL